MPAYKITIRGEVSKSYIVTAPDEDEATYIAHQMFNVVPDGTQERYSEETEAVMEVNL